MVGSFPSSLKKHPGTCVLQLVFQVVFGAKNSNDISMIFVFCLALLLTILLFMDQQITSVIVNRKEHKLKKGAGYHLDMLIVGVMMGLSSILGLPWCVAATVLCLGHVDSLKMETETSAPGEKPRFLGVREQRVTGVMVFLLTGLSVVLAPILKVRHLPIIILNFSPKIDDFHQIFCHLKNLFTVHSNACALWCTNVHGRGLPQRDAICGPDWTFIHATKIPTRLFLLASRAN